MKHPPQESDLIPGRTVTGVVLGTVAATVAGVVIAFGVARCQAEALGGDWMRGASPRVAGEVNAIEREVFGGEAQGLEGHAGAERRLASYGWVDPGRQIVRVPIGVAIELFLARQREAGGRP